MRFVGLKPLEMDKPLIEFETTAGEVLDLYNEHDLRSAVLDADGLAFEFVSTVSESFVPSHSHVVVLRFRGIRNLRVEQPSDWAPQEADQIEDLLIRRTIGPWPQLVFNAGGLDYEFDCEEICLSVVPL